MIGMGIPEINSIWLITLGKVIIHSFWIGFAMTLLVKMLFLLIREDLAEIKYWISTTALFSFSFIIVFLFIRIFRIDSSLIPAVNHPIGLNLQQNLSNSGYQGGKAGIPLLTYIIFSYLYFAGVLIFILKWMISVINLVYLRKSSSLLKGDAEALLVKMQRRVGINGTISLRLSDRIDSPAVIGFLKPSIIVPVGMLTHLPMNQVEAIFLHELSHLKRYDFVINLLQVFIETIFFYHPAVWFLSSTIRIEREKSCDDFVIRKHGNSLIYAKALMNLTEFKIPAAAIAPSANGGNRNLLFKRINRILNEKPMKTNMREKLITPLLIVISGIILFSVSSFSSGFNIRQTDGSELELKSADRSGLDENSESSIELRDAMQAVTVMDTVPELPSEALEDPEIEKKLEQLRIAEEAIAEIDWEEIRADMEFDIDMDSMKIEIKEALREIEEIDWEAIREDIRMDMSELEGIDLDDMMEDVRKSLDEIDLEAILDEARKSIEDIDMEKIREDIELSMKSIDFEEMHADIEKACEDIDFDQIKIDIEKEKEKIKKEIQELEK